MKHKPYTCDCCDKETKRARRVSVENMKNPMLCTKCNLELINEERLILSDKQLLKVTGKRGDFLIIEAFNYREKTKEEQSNDFWKNRRRVKEQAQMDNQSTVGWDVHESY